MSTYALIAAIAYLLGSIPFGYILVRLLHGEDVRQMGSGNIGATNVARKAPGLGVATLILDAAKGFLAVEAGMAIMGRDLAGITFKLAAGSPSPVPGMLYAAGAVAAVFSILGHVFPVWLKFKGGKGVATGVGSFLALAPKAVLLVLVIFAVLVSAFRYISLGSIVATAAFPVFAWLLYRGQATPLFFGAMIAAAALIIVKHHQNIRRLLAGTEHRFELKRGAKA